MLEKIQETKGFTPPALLSRPILSQFERPFYNAFQTLNGSRQWTTGGPAPIQISEILAYLVGHLEIFDIDEREEYIIVLRSMDTVFLENINKKRPK